MYVRCERCGATLGRVDYAEGLEIKCRRCKHLNKFSSKTPRRVIEADFYGFVDYALIGDCLLLDRHNTQKRNQEILEWYKDKLTGRGVS